MKYQMWFRLSMLFCIVMFITTLIYSCISVVNLFGVYTSLDWFRELVYNELNSKLLSIMGILNIIGVSVIFTTLSSLSEQSDKLGKLDEEIIKYQNARIRLNKKIDEL